MKIRSNKKGVYYAHLVGSNPINLKTRNREEAFRLAKEARLEDIEFAAKAKLLTAEAVQRLSAGGSKVSGIKAVDYWQSQCEDHGLSPATLHSYRSHISRFIDEAKLRDVPISNVTSRMVDRFVNADDAVVVSTRRMRRASLDSFFRTCAARGLVMSNPVADIRIKMHKLSFEQKEPVVREPFTEAEVEKLLTVTHDFWRTAIAMALHYGLRLSDVAQLEWACFGDETVTVWTDKHDRRIEMPLLPEVRAIVDSLPRTNTKHLFPEQYATVRDMSSRAKLSVQFGRILKSLGIEGKSFHCLRHTFATRRASLGESVDEIRLKMGHANATTTSGYIHSA